MSVDTVDIFTPPPPPEAPPESPPEATAPPAESQPVAQSAVAAERLDDMAQIILAYNQVTQKLQRSHEQLTQQVARLQQQLASTDAQLQRSKRLAALGEMAAGIAHEIRNPLAGIGLYANMLVQDLAHQPTAQNARKIAAAVRSLNAIVTDVLAFARELHPCPAPLTVSHLFHRALDAHRPAIDAAHVQTTLDIEPADLALEGDADLLHQALLNLIRNAVDALALHGGPGPRRLTLAARRDPAGLTLSLRDTGPGIADEHIDRIFNPFFTTRSTGTGLGLAIVHRIIDAHAGAITVHNDHGAVFELRLPNSLALLRERAGARVFTPDDQMTGAPA